MEDFFDEDIAEAVEYMQDLIEELIELDDELAADEWDEDEDWDYCEDE